MLRMTMEIHVTLAVQGGSASRFDTIAGRNIHAADFQWRILIVGKSCVFCVTRALMMP
jgi:hypothetical protein